MFGSTKAFSSFAVDDRDVARKFYGETLGLVVTDVAGADGPLMLHLPQGQQIFVYPKPDHTPATFTVLNFAVEDIDASVDELAARGVPVRRHDGSPVDDRGIYRADDHSIAWFDDPAGNSLAVVQADIGS